MFQGKVVVDKKTKELVKRIKADEIAVIDHQDLDQIAGQSLVERKVKAVLNVSKSISGKYPNQGPLIIANSGIKLFDCCDDYLFTVLKDGDQVQIDKGLIFKDGQLLGRVEELSSQIIEERLKKARANLQDELLKFIDNTLTYARKEKELIFDIPIPEIELSLQGLHALIVVRGADYKDDLEAIKSYIHEMKPVIIAVDGGADACLERGYLPAIIIGDMDSISDKALKCGADLIVHAYPDGRAPGLKRIKDLGLKAITFPAPGTSEDIAMLLAYEKGAELITAVGTHSHMIDFLEKGRPGMASTLLVRLKVGSKLVDAKGLSKLYQNHIHYHYWVQIILSVLLPIAMLGIFSPSIRQFLQLLVLRISLILNF